MIPLLLSIQLVHPRSGFNEEILFATVALSFFVFLMAGSWFRSKRNQTVTKKKAQERRPIR